MLLWDWSKNKEKRDERVKVDGSELDDEGRSLGADDKQDEVSRLVALISVELGQPGAMPQNNTSFSIYNV